VESAAAEAGRVRIAVHCPFLAGITVIYHTFRSLQVARCEKVTGVQVRDNLSQSGPDGTGRVRTEATTGVHHDACRSRHGQLATA
jgi:hypothetical protein